jgi:hypothetical protein
VALEARLVDGAVVVTLGAGDVSAAGEGLLEGGAPG